MNVALACIAKNEDYYINEWLEYNLYLGFDKIFVYNNDWQFHIDSPFVETISVEGRGKQEVVYNNFLNEYKNEYDWVAFFDVDEFLVLKKHDNIKDFLKDYNGFNCIGINWHLFGDNNQPKPTNEYSVLKRFTRRGLKVDKHIKCIVRPSVITNYKIHAPDRDSIIDTDKNVFYGPYNENGKDDIAQLNHYFTKTIWEWQIKKNRGRVCEKKIERSDSDFYNHNLNEVEDLHALNFFTKKSTIF